MLPTEAINRIRVLSERGIGSKAIAKSTGISRNIVRKYLSQFQTLTPISSEVQRPSRLDSSRYQIHEWFLACRGHCPVVLRKVQSELGAPNSQNGTGILSKRNRFVLDYPLAPIWVNPWPFFFSGVAEIS